LKKLNLKGIFVSILPRLFHSSIYFRKISLLGKEREKMGEI